MLDFHVGSGRNLNVKLYFLGCFPLDILNILFFGSMFYFEKHLYIGITSYLCIACISCIEPNRAKVGTDLSMEETMVPAVQISIIWLEDMHSHYLPW